MLNHITIMGRLTKDPEMKTTNAGVAYTTFSIACDRDFTPKGGEREVDFFNCTAWRTTAEFINKYFTRGQMIVIEGRMQSQKWTDRDGHNRTSYSIVANNCYFSGPKKDAGQDAAPVQNAGYAYADPYHQGQPVSVPYPQVPAGQPPYPQQPVYQPTAPQVPITQAPYVDVNKEELPF